ncbi:MAG: chemotaxis protein CheW [Beijerinckiaceae bacterium]
MSEITRTNTTHPRELIAFRVGTQDFCIDVMSVREIRGWTPATTLPQAPSFVRGVINLRGAVLPIVDLAARLGFPAAEPSARHVIIVTQVGGQVGNQFAGLLVDAVSDILNTTDDLIQPTPDIASEAAKSFVRGILAVEGRMISLIEIDSVLPTMERKAA